MSAHVLLNLLNELGKKDKMRGLLSILLGTDAGIWTQFLHLQFFSHVNFSPLPGQTIQYATLLANFQS